MAPLLSCEFNMDTVCMELKFADGSMISIDCIAVENEVVKNMYQQSELDYLIYNDPVGYADLILNGDLEEYLKNVTDYTPLDLNISVADFHNLPRSFNYCLWWLILL